MQKTDKRYILIVNNCLREQGTIWEYTSDYKGKYWRNDEILCAFEDAQICTPVVIDGMLYAKTENVISTGLLKVIRADTLGNRIVKCTNLVRKDGGWYAHEEANGKRYLIIVSSDTALISDGVLPIKNADEVLIWLEGEKNDNIQNIANKWWYKLDEGVREECAQKYLNCRWKEATHIEITRIYEIITDAAPVPADTDKKPCCEFMCDGTCEKTGETLVPDNTTNSDASMQQVKGERDDNVLYTYYEVDLEEMPLDWDTTICESLDDVRDLLQYLDIYLDEDIDKEIKRGVFIRGIAMTPLAYREWYKENRSENFINLPVTTPDTAAYEQEGENTNAANYLKANFNVHVKGNPNGRKFIEAPLIELADAIELYKDLHINKDILRGGS